MFGHLKRQLHISFIVGIFRTTVHVVYVQKLQNRYGRRLQFVFFEMLNQDRHFQQFDQLGGGYQIRYQEYY